MYCIDNPSIVSPFFPVCITVTIVTYLSGVGFFFTWYSCVFLSRVLFHLETAIMRGSRRGWGVMGVQPPPPSTCKTQISLNWIINLLKSCLGTPPPRANSNNCRILLEKNSGSAHGHCATFFMLNRIVINLRM